MISRISHKILQEYTKSSPVVTVTGPRQSGKTTLCRMALPKWQYVSLEMPDVQHHAVTDPRGFLSDLSQKGVILDEIQRAPELPSYLLGMVDDDPSPGRDILTGSHNFRVIEAVSQSLAGRSYLLELMPFSLQEILSFKSAPNDVFELIRTGGYPAIYDRKQKAYRWLSAYLTMYVERDVRQILNVSNLAAFKTFLALCAGNSGQLLNLSRIGADSGISTNTAKSWLSILEASYIAFRIPPLIANIRKRLVKTPKLYFYDAGFLCRLLKIQTAEQLKQHPLRGAIFENWVVSEAMKWFLHRGEDPSLYFYRDRKGMEVDLIIQHGQRMIALEIKSGQTAVPEFFKPLAKLRHLLAEPDLHTGVLYAGDSARRQQGSHLIPWSQLDHYLTKRIDIP